MVLTDGMEALKAILSCVHSDGNSETHAYIEEKNEAKLKKLCLSELAPGMLLLATDKGRNFDNEGRKLGRYACMSPLFKQDGNFDQNRACDAVLIRGFNFEVQRLMVVWCSAPSSRRIPQTGF